jgi:hypothetical protein
MFWKGSIDLIVSRTRKSQPQSPGTKTVKKDYAQLAVTGLKTGFISHPLEADRAIMTASLPSSWPFFSLCDR